MFYNIEQLEEAIAKGVKIDFDYMHYNTDKQLVKRRDAKYVINPYQIICCNRKYYLICTYDGIDEISHYRLDMIRNIQLLEQKQELCLPENIQFDDYADTVIFGFGGQKEQIQMLCDSSILDHVIDEFGTEIHILPQASGRFSVVFQAAPMGVKFWALQFLPYCEVQSPQWLRQEIIDAMQQGTQRYK